MVSGGLTHRPAWRAIGRTQVKLPQDNIGDHFSPNLAETNVGLGHGVQIDDHCKDVS